jgi:type IV secretion system protein TrbE
VNRQQRGRIPLAPPSAAVTNNINTPEQGVLRYSTFSGLTAPSGRFGESDEAAGATRFVPFEGRLDGRPTLLIVDEGWLALDDPTFGARLREWLKTLRKKNASVVFATQSLADIETSAVASAIIESCPTRLFLPNERAVEPQILSIYRRFGLNDRQIEIIARAIPKRDYYCQSRRGNRLFELGLGEVALAFTAASLKTDQAAIAEVMLEHGRDGFAAAWLHRKGLVWAADLINAELTTPHNVVTPSLWAIP